MALSSHRTCNSCDAVFNLTHSMDTDYYNLKFCPFCGEHISDEDLGYDEDVDE